MSLILRRGAGSPCISRKILGLALWGRGWLLKCLRVEDIVMMLVRQVVGIARSIAGACTAVTEELAPCSWGQRHFR